MLHVQYISIDDLVITATQKKTIYLPSGHALVDLAHLLLGQVVASLLSFCVTKMTPQMTTRLILRLFKHKKAKSLISVLAQELGICKCLYNF